MADISSNSDVEPEEECLTSCAIEITQQIRNPNTTRKTASDMKKFVDWLKGVGEINPPEFIPFKQLDQYMADFFLTAKKLDGEDYEPESLKSFQCSINRYLTEKRVAVNVLVGREFKHSRDTLLLKRKELKKLDKRGKLTKAEPFTPEEIDLLYDMNLLGTDNPKALINTIFLNNAIFFGMESRRQHTRLRWGDIELKTTDMGGEYLQCNGTPIKTKIGILAYRIPSTLVAESDNTRCPIQTYKIYAAKRPIDMMTPESPFYIGVSRQSKPNCWFASYALGKNTIGGIVKTLCEEAGITGRRINYSARKSAMPSDDITPRQSRYAHVYVEQTGDEWKEKSHCIMPKPNERKREHGTIICQMDASELSAVEEKISRQGIIVNGVHHSRENHDSSMSQNAYQSGEVNTDITTFAVKIENADDEYNIIPLVSHIDSTFNKHPLSNSCLADTDVLKQSNSSPIKPAQSVVVIDIAKLEAERLAVEQERLAVARKRLELEKQLLRIEQERVQLETKRLESTRRAQNIP